MLTNQISKKPLGARSLSGEKGVEFRVWAPEQESLELITYDQGEARVSPLAAEEGGFFSTTLAEATPGTRYKFKFSDGGEFPDPASRFQPEGPLGPSEVFGDNFSWQDQNWQGVPLNQLVIYELHIGTFTKEGTFEGAIGEIPRLKDLGINAIEILPVSQFSGERNWGYDGVYPHAVQSTYGGPEALKRLINACHMAGIAVILDCVYNHLGPEGNFLPKYFPVFQDRYHTPWGQAINFDGAYSDGVRKYFLQTIWQWLDEFHIDGLRLDAIQTIFDTSPKPFLEDLTELAADVERLKGYPIAIIGETDANDPKVVKSSDVGGLGLDAHWNDDLHHTIHKMLTQENSGYYVDFDPLEDFKRLFEEGVAYAGRYSEYRKHTHGRNYQGVSSNRLVVCAQNHDQIGNRMRGDRLSTLLDFERLKLAPTLYLLTPFLPMLYMGEEYGEESPFLYFVSHEGKELNDAVRNGRREEFKSFKWEGEAPDPVAEKTFQLSKMDSSKSTSGRGKVLVGLYQRLIGLSKEIRARGLLDRENVQVEISLEQNLLHIKGKENLNLVVNFSDKLQNRTQPMEVSELLVDTSLHQEGASLDDSYSKRLTDLRKELKLPPHSAVAFKGNI